MSIFLLAQCRGVESMSEDNGGKSDGPAARRPAAEIGGGKKFTLRVGGAVDFRLGVIARRLGLSKAQLGLRLIEQGLERFALDAELRALYARIGGEIGEKA
jgi:hypothetical protein